MKAVKERNGKILQRGTRAKGSEEEKEETKRNAPQSGRTEIVNVPRK